jgi:hypothetical protein
MTSHLLCSVQLLLLRQIGMNGLKARYNWLSFVAFEAVTRQPCTDRVHVLATHSIIIVIHVVI